MKIPVSVVIITKNEEENIAAKQTKRGIEKQIAQLQKDLDNLRRYDASVNANNFYGNPFLYHFQFKNLLNCKREKGKYL